jgi:hypothetical protein
VPRYYICVALLRRPNGSARANVGRTNNILIVADRSGLPDQEALHFLARLAREECELLFGFNAFRDYRQIQAAP